MGKMRPEVWSAQKDYAKGLLPAPFAELVEKTQQPFVQCITDVSAPKAVHFEVKKNLFYPRMYSEFLFEEHLELFGTFCFPQSNSLSFLPSWL